MPGNGDALLVAAVRIDCSKVCKDAPTAHGQEHSQAAQLTLLSSVAGPTTDMTGINPWKCFNSLYVYPNMPQLGAYTAVGTDAGKVLALLALGAGLILPSLATPSGGTTPVPNLPPLLRPARLLVDLTTAAATLVVKTTIVDLM